MFLGKFEMLEASRSPRNSKSVLSDLSKKLWPLQRRAVNFTKKLKGVLLAMEMGTGKTLTTITSLAYRHYIGGVDKVLIICPATAIHVWKREIKKWAPGTGIQFAVLSYEFSRFYFRYLRKEKWDAIVCDESHKLKNHASQQSRRIYRIASWCKYKYCLTGTPIAKTTIDLFGQFRVVKLDVLGEKWTAFKANFLHPDGFMGYDVGITRQNREKVLKLISPYTFQATKKELGLKDRLPPVRIYAELKRQQKKIYDDVATEMISECKDWVLTTPLPITQSLRLQQICGGSVPSDDGGLIEFESAKLAALEEFLKDWDREKKLVIFARFIYELQAIHKLCKRLKYTSEIYSTKRPELEDEFQKKDHPQVFISQIQKGSVAITLTRSSTPVFFSKTHSYLDYEQAVSRCERGGQTEAVSPVFIIAKNTVDELIEDSIQKKYTEAKYVKKFMAFVQKKRLDENS